MNYSVYDLQSNDIIYIEQRKVKTSHPTVNDYIFSILLFFVSFSRLLITSSIFTTENKAILTNRLNFIGYFIQKQSLFGNKNIWQLIEMLDFVFSLIRTRYTSNKCLVFMKKRHNLQQQPLQIKIWQ